MSKYLVSFSTTWEDEKENYSDFELKQLRLIDSAERFGIKNYKKWTRTSLKEKSFYKQNKVLLDEKTGAGMWIWKPYIILDALEKIEDGDFVVYADTSLFFIEDPKVLFDLCEKNSGFFFIQMDSSWNLSTLVKRELFHFLQIDKEEYYSAPMTEAYFMIFQKNAHTIDFVKGWLKWCLVEKYVRPIMFTDIENPPQYKGHPCDMPLLAVKRILEGIEAFRNPSQFGNHLKMPEYRVAGEYLSEGKYREEEIFYNSPYGTLLKYDKEGLNCKRPLNHYLNPSFYWNKSRKAIFRFI
jgi:hypothetical protein